MTVNFSKIEQQSQNASSYRPKFSPKKEGKRNTFNESILDSTNRQVLSKSYSLAQLKSNKASLRETISFQHIQDS